MMKGINDSSQKKSSQKKDPVATEPKFVQLVKKEERTYEIFSHHDAESAKTFLLKRTIKQDMYHMIIETPEGVWGIDKFGLYLEQLLPFQLNMDQFDCHGCVCSAPAKENLEMVSNGMNESFIIKIACGQCSQEWMDGVRYQNATIVRCPQCRSLNKVETFHIQKINALAYPLFDLFLQGLNDVNRAKAITAMLSIPLSHEILVIYPDQQAFLPAMNIMQKLPRHYHPIAMRYKQCGAIYMRCYFSSTEEFYIMRENFTKNSDCFYSNPDEAHMILGGVS